MTPPYQVRILDAAARDLARLDQAVAQRIVERIAWLAANWTAAKLQPLTGDLAGLYKLRVGEYRVIYEFLHQEHTIVIHMIGHRSTIYRKR